MRVDSGERTLARFALGHSMAGVPANRRMRFRIGSIAIPPLITLLLQLQDEGRLSLDDSLADYLPRMPNAHTNYAVLSQVVAKVTGRPVSELMDERIFKPLGLRHTAISRLPAMAGPVLHSYATERGPYEDSTF